MDNEMSRQTEEEQGARQIQQGKEAIDIQSDKRKKKTRMRMSIWDDQKHSQRETSNKLGYGEGR